MYFYLMQFIKIIFLFLLLSSCNNETAQLKKKEKAINKQITSTFGAVKDWKKHQSTVQLHLKALDSLLPQLHLTTNKNDYRFEFESDSLHFLTTILNHLDTISVTRTNYGAGKFWTDTTLTGENLLRYTLHPQPQNKHKYTLTVYRREQE